MACPTAASSPLLPLCVGGGAGRKALTSEARHMLTTKSVALCDSGPLSFPLLFICFQVEAPGQEAMMSEILARGPVTCGMATAELFDYGERGAALHACSGLVCRSP